jgi:hypothetical protein
VLTTSATYRLIAADLPRSLATTAAKPVVSRESAYYLENIGSVKSIDDFLKNDRLFNFAMKAFGLGDMTYAKAFMRKVLTEGVDEKNSFANKLADKRYKEFATAFNFARYDEATTTFTRTQQGTVDKYVRQALEEDAGTNNEGVRLALYFERNAGNATSAYDILADPALLQVVQTTLDLSPSTGLADIDVQAEMISKRIDVADFKDPEQLQKFLTRFTNMWEAGNPSQPASSPLLNVQPIEIGISTSLLMSMQNLKLGGR